MEPLDDSLSESIPISSLCTNSTYNQSPCFSVHYVSMYSKLFYGRTSLRLSQLKFFSFKLADLKFKIFQNPPELGLPGPLIRIRPSTSPPLSPTFKFSYLFSMRESSLETQFKAGVRPWIPAINRRLIPALYRFSVHYSNKIWCRATIYPRLIAD